MRDCTLEEYVHDLIHYVTDDLDERYSEEMKLELLSMIFSKYVLLNTYNDSEDKKEETIIENDNLLENYASSLISRILYGLNERYSVEMRLELASLVLWVLFSKREFERE